MATYNIQNAPKDLGMVSIKSMLTDFGGLAKSARFVTRISRPANMAAFVQPTLMNDLTYLCEATEMPGRSFNNIDVRYYGPNQKIPFQTVYEDINMTFLCRDQSLERQFFDDWQYVINPTNTFDFNYRDEYQAQIDLFTISDLDSDNDDTLATYHYSLLGAFPVMVNPQPVTWADGDFMRLTVTFTYSSWTRPEREPESKPFRMIKLSQINVEQPTGPETAPRGPVMVEPYE